MRKILLFVLALGCTFSLAACNNAQEVQISTYAFHGEHEFFSISKGSIVLSDTEDVFDGGTLSVVNPEIFDGITTYSTTFYTVKNDAQRTLMSNSVVDFTGGSIHVEGDLGKMFGENLLVGNTIESIDELRENLWFELKTVDLNGVEATYQMQLTLIE